MPRLVILSGPSCIGKGPLCAALSRLYHDLARRLQPVVLYNSRPPRPDEVDGVDYHFRTRAEIEALRLREGFHVLEARADLQAIDLAALEATFATGDAFFEGNPYVARELQTCPLPAGVGRLSIFLAPLSRDEILFLRDPERHVVLPVVVADIIRRKLLRRAQRQKGILSLRDLEDVETRAACAYAELKMACRFDHVVPNHDGEDSENWDAFPYPIGDARGTLLAVAALLEGREPLGVEHWEKDLLP